MKDNQNILGLDLGPSSIGWALYTRDSRQIVAMGVRTFDAGLDGLETDGKGVSRNAARRDARSARRRLQRHTRRLIKLAGILQRAGLLPTGNLKDPTIRHTIFNELDKSTGSIYTLRKRGLEQQLGLYELGRVLYHLAQRRGFLSNRKSAMKDEEEEGRVYDGIKSLRDEIASKGVRTLGEYFSFLDGDQRIRSRYTSRHMYEDEFALIWEAQGRYYPDKLTESLRELIHDAIFFQRLLRSQKHLIGPCEIFPERRRAPEYLLGVQRLQYLQKANDLQIVDNETGEIQPLTSSQRDSVVSCLEYNGDTSFAQLKKELGLKSRRFSFNLERGGEKKIIGNRTAARLVPILSRETWESLGETRQNRLIHDLQRVSDPSKLSEMLSTFWKFDKETAEKLSRVRLPDNYSRFSKQAVDLILPHLQNGKPLQTIIRELFPDKFEGALPPCDLLPPVVKLYKHLRNPIVFRALSELRLVVNSIVREYGKPDIIRIELAREMKKPAKVREELWKANRKNETQREAARDRIIKEAGIEHPTFTDIRKVMLAEECDWHCPYTGKTIGFRDLFGHHPLFDIEHIIPFHVCLDDSFTNVTLCCSEHNRDVKKKRTPYQAYFGTPDWDDIIKRVKSFQGRVAEEKLRKFRMNDEELQAQLQDFTNRQLQDTSYAARLAKKYLGQLYGGTPDKGIDGNGKLRIQATNGQLTSLLRGALELNGVLSGTGLKSRDDHRHHAIDALVCALIDNGTIKKLCTAAAKGKRGAHGLHKELEKPWPDFVRDVTNAIEDLVTSHKVSNRVRGPLHELTNYSPQKTDEKGKPYVHVRVPLEKLGKNVDDIVDHKVKATVKKALGNGKPEEAFKQKESHPFISSRKGKIPIHTVRIRKNLKVRQFGSGANARHVGTSENHHMEFFEAKDKKGNVYWDADVVSLPDAYQRKAKKEPIVDREHRPNRKFLFSLCGGDIIELDMHNSKERALFRVRTIPQSKQIYFVGMNDARELKHIGKIGLTAVPESLRERKCRKIVVTPLGEVRYANN